MAGRENNHYPSNWYCIEHFYCSSSLASERDVLNLPLFQRSNEKLTLIKPAKFTNEKELQNLIERNLDVIFNCRLVASEYSTGPVHGGRIDSLALSEENNPVIIEYKVIESSQLINQSLYYLSWINDHRGDFEIAVQKAFPKENIQVDWSSIRVICIAPEYKKYDLHAVKMMGSNIELWQYRYFSNGSLFFEEVFKKSVALSGTVNERSKDPLMATNAFFDTGCIGLQKVAFLILGCISMQLFSLCNPQRQPKKYCSISDAFPSASTTHRQVRRHSLQRANIS